MLLFKFSLDFHNALEEPSCYSILSCKTIPLRQMRMSGVYVKQIRFCLCPFKV